MASQMIASTGTANFIRLHGQPALLGIKVSELTRDNQDGRAYRVDGQRADEFQLDSEVDAPNAAGANTLALLYHSFRGRTVQFTLDTGVTYSSYFCLGVTVAPPQRITTAAGGLNVNPQYMLRAVWRIIYPLGS